MNDFTGRFLPRIYEMRNDKDENIISHAIDLLQILYSILNLCN